MSVKTNVKKKPIINIVCYFIQKRRKCFIFPNIMLLYYICVEEFVVSKIDIGVSFENDRMDTSFMDSIMQPGIADNGLE